MFDAAFAGIFGGGGFRSSSASGKLNFLRWLNEKSEQKYFLSYYEKASQTIENGDLSLSDCYFHQQKLLDELDLYLDGQPSRKNPAHLQEGIAATESWFLIRMLEYLLRSVNQRKITGMELQFAWKDAVLQYLSESEASQIPVVRLLYRMYQVQEAPDDKSSYDALRKMLTEQAPELSKGERLNLFTLLINHSIRRLKPRKGRIPDRYFCSVPRNRSH